MKLDTQAGIERTPPGALGGTRGFSLIEIALALAVISFGIVGLIGLLAVSLDLGRASSQDTLIASMARQVIAELRAMPFDTLPAGTSSEVVYFDNDAHKLTTMVGAVYQCKPALTINTSFNTTGSTGSAVVNFYDVQMPFSIVGPAKPPILATPQSSVARYAAPSP